MLVIGVRFALKRRYRRQAIENGIERTTMKLLTFSLFLFAATTASADVDVVSQSGVWGATCPPIICSAPGDSWSYSFHVDSILTSILNVGPQGPISDFEFLLNGSSIPSLADAFNAVEFFTGPLDGGFSLQPETSLSSGGTPQPQFGEWTQLFSQAPVGLVPADLIPGVYPVVTLDSPQCSFFCGFEQFMWSDDLGGGHFADDFTPGPVVITDTPEPTSVILLLTMLLALLFVARKRIACADPHHSRH